MKMSLVLETGAQLLQSDKYFLFFGQRLVGLFVCFCNLALILNQTINTGSKCRFSASIQRKLRPKSLGITNIFMHSLTLRSSKLIEQT